MTPVEAPSAPLPQGGAFSGPAKPDPRLLPGSVDATTISRLKWRCRRGLLENDLFVERFFRRHESGLTLDQVHGLQALMDLSDNDLLDLLLARKEPEGELDRPDVMEVLAMLRQPG
jgi:antitoxin CptB